MESTTMGERIQAARRIRKLTQIQVAEALDISPSSVSKYERDELDNPCSKTIRELKRLLQVSSDWLLDGDGEGPVESAEVAA